MLPDRNFSDFFIALDQSFSSSITFHCIVTTTALSSTDGRGDLERDARILEGIAGLDKLTARNARAQLMMIKIKRGLGSTRADWMHEGNTMEVVPASVYRSSKPLLREKVTDSSTSRIT